MPGIRFLTRAAAILVATALGGADHVQAQACKGSPALPGRPAVDAGLGWGETVVSYGAQFIANPAGPLGMNATYSRSTGRTIDVDSHALGAGIRYEIPISGVSVCPSTGLGYAHSETRVRPGTASRSNAISANFGVTAGAVVLDRRRIRIAPFAGPHYGIARTVFDSGGGHTGSLFGANAGALFVIADRMYSVGSVSFTEGGNATYGIQVGLLLR